MAPLAEPSTKAEEEVRQQQRPNPAFLPPSALTEEVSQLQGLFQFLEKNFYLPPAPIEIGNGLRAPGKIVRQKTHLPQFSVHFHQRPHPAQTLRIIFLRNPYPELDHIISQNITNPCFLQPACYSAPQIVFGSGDPENFPHRQIGQVRKIQVGLVEDYDFTRGNCRTKLASPTAIVFGGALNDRALRKKRLQI